MRKSDWQITVILFKQRTNVAEAHSSFLDVLIVSSPLCVVKSNMGATMWIRFVRNFLACHSNNKICSRFKVNGVSSSSQYLVSWGALKFWWYIFCILFAWKYTISALTRSLKLLINKKRKPSFRTVEIAVLPQSNYQAANKNGRQLTIISLWAYANDRVCKWSCSGVPTLKGLYVKGFLS